VSELGLEVLPSLRGLGVLPPVRELGLGVLPPVRELGLGVLPPVGGLGLGVLPSVRGLVELGASGKPGYRLFREPLVVD
jgi:hypothetical protein